MPTRRLIELEGVRVFALPAGKDTDGHLVVCAPQTKTPTSMVWAVDCRCKGYVNHGHCWAATEALTRLAQA